MSLRRPLTFKDVNTFGVLPTRFVRVRLPVLLVPVELSVHLVPVLDDAPKKVVVLYVEQEQLSSALVSLRSLVCRQAGKAARGRVVKAGISRRCPGGACVARGALRDLPELGLVLVAAPLPLHALHQCRAVHDRPG